MNNLLAKFWQDDCGALLTAEFVLMMGILVFGVAGSLALVRNSLQESLAKIAAINSTIIPDVATIRQQTQPVQVQSAEVRAYAVNHNVVNVTVYTPPVNNLPAP